MSEENIEVNDINVNQKIKPYLEALSFFTKIKSISNHFSQKYKQNNTNPNLPREYNSINDFIFDFKNDYISIKEGEEKNELEAKKLLQKNPEKIFNFLLNELHKIFKDKKDDEDNKTKIKAVEYDSQVSYNLFDEFRKKDRSEISDLFFGEKKIIKHCNNCNLTQYIFKYLKYINIDIKKCENQFDLKHCLKGIEYKYDTKLFCQMCSSTQDFNIKLSIVKKPEILIIVVSNYHNSTKVDIPLFIYRNCYKLICVVTKENENNSFLHLIDMFGCFNKCKKNNTNYKIYYDGDEVMINIKGDNSINLINKNENEIKEGNPYVLFYKKIQEDINDMKKLNDDYESSANILISNMDDKKTDIDYNDNLQNNNNPKIRNLSIKNDINNVYIKKNKKNNNKQINNINNYEYNDDDNMNNNINNYKNIITLHFNFQNEKQLYIDVDECETFSNIIKEFNKNYKDQLIINEDTLFFNNNPIDCKKSPKELGIGNNSHINVIDY